VLRAGYLKDEIGTIGARGRLKARRHLASQRLFCDRERSEDGQRRRFWRAQT
jgi:hypothetical protein